MLPDGRGRPLAALGSAVPTCPSEPRAHGLPRAWQAAEPPIPRNAHRVGQKALLGPRSLATKAQKSQATAPYEFVTSAPGMVQVCAPPVRGGLSPVEVLGGRSCAALASAPRTRSATAVRRRGDHGARLLRRRPAAGHPRRGPAGRPGSAAACSTSRPRRPSPTASTTQPKVIYAVLRPRRRHLRHLRAQAAPRACSR